MKAIHTPQRKLALILSVGLVALAALACGLGGDAQATQQDQQAQEPTPEPLLLTPTPSGTATPSSPGSSGDPVISNDEWTPMIQDIDGVEMALVPRGCFMMGSDKGGSDEKPVHEQCFDQPFWIDVYEVTNAQYGSASELCPDWSSGDNQPRICVNWFDAAAHCESRGARLPTEAEWEYAARGPDGLPYPWGDEFVAGNVVYVGNSGDQTAEVGSRSGGVSWVGAMDMSGNVMEWTSSIYAPYPYDATDGRETDGSRDSSSLRVIRGGSWGNSVPRDLRAAPRVRVDPANRSGGGGGFRCARSF